MKFKKLKNVKSPTIAYKSDAGIDVYSPEDGFVEIHKTKQIKLGIAIQLHQDEVAIMSERSGMAIKYGITSIGNIIDSGYRGEISIILKNGSDLYYTYKKGDKIGQMIICKLGDRYIQEVKELSDTERGKKAHYSSGQ